MRKMKVLNEKLRNSILYQIIFFLLIMIMLFGLYFGAAEIVKWKVEKNVVKELQGEKNFNFVTSLKDSIIDNDKIVISGVASCPDTIISKVTLSLREIDTGEEYIYKTTLLEDKMMSKNFNSFWNESAGFTSIISKEEISQEDCYEVLLTITYEVEKEDASGKKLYEKYRTKLLIDKYLYEGNLYGYNPVEFFSPNVLDDEQRKIINSGEVLLFDKAKEFWVYKYNSNIYWIAKFSLFGELTQGPELPLWVYRLEQNASENRKMSLYNEYQGYYLTDEDYSKYSPSDYVMYSVPMEIDETIVGIETGIYFNNGDKKGWSLNMKKRLDPYRNLE